ncbi:MAG: type I-B CRISPR-associated endonuclease Cas1b [Clostridia bacterium]|nr:type I-B CRISPR-associated endonuclease Cas1b [Clostridia bacterium]
MKEESKYIFSKGDLSRKDFSIKYKNDKGNFYLPIQNIKEIYCFNEITLSTKLLEAIAKAGIIVHFFNYYENYVGTFYPKENLVSGSLVVKQSLKFSNDRNSIAKAIVQGIADNIHSVLYHYYRHGSKELKEVLDFYKDNVPSLLEKVDDIKSILAIEGKIWAEFYATFKYFLPEEFLMNKRVKRPPDNPMNALISFGNTLLYTKTISQIYNTHLDQTISFLHEPSEARFSLSLDLSEVFKPIIVYKTIFELVNNKKIRVEKHFDKRYNYALLNEEGKKIFINAFEDRMNNTFEHAKLKRQVSYKQAIKLDGYKLIKNIVENKGFKPFNMEEKQ